MNLDSLRNAADLSAIKPHGRRLNYMGGCKCWLHSIPAPLALLCRHPLESYAVTRYDVMPPLDWVVRYHPRRRRVRGTT